MTQYRGGGYAVISSFLVAFSWIIIIQISNVQGNEFPIQKEKIYVDHERVHFIENKIFVVCQNHLVRIESLHSDETGLYFVAQETCPFCGWPWTPWGCTNPSCPGYAHPMFSLS